MDRASSSFLGRPWSLLPILGPWFWKASLWLGRKECMRSSSLSLDAHSKDSKSSTLTKSSFFGRMLRRSRVLLKSLFLMVVGWAIHWSAPPVSSSVIMNLNDSFTRLSFQRGVAFYSFSASSGMKYGRISSLPFWSSYSWNTLLRLTSLRPWLK
jgi:hypothetical protein